MKSTSVSESKLKNILSALENLKYGTVLITIHDSRIVQIDRTEKHRYPLQKPEDSN